MNKDQAIATIDRFRRELFEAMSQNSLEAMNDFATRWNAEDIAEAGHALVEFIEGRLASMRGNPIVEVIEAMWHHLQGMAAMSSVSAIIEQAQAMVPASVEPSPFDGLDDILKK